MYHSFPYFSISHSCLLLAQLLYKFTVRPLAVPTSLSHCSHFFILITDYVCIDTAPPSYTAVRGHCSPAGVELNGEVNDSGHNSGMPPLAITGREEERKRKAMGSKKIDERSRMRGKKEQTFLE